MKKMTTILLTAAIFLTIGIVIPKPAEGIETEEEYQIMRGLGADYAQGYFLKKPNISLY